MGFGARSQAGLTPGGEDAGATVGTDAAPGRAAHSSALRQLESPGSVSYESLLSLGPVMQEGALWRCCVVSVPS